jgi:glycosyltransferase involved in cell wall biosynthesis
MNINNIKIIHLSTFNGLTGAGIACKRLNEAFVNKGVNSKIISLYDIKGKINKKFKSQKLKLIIYNRIEYLFRSKKSHYSSGLFGISINNILSELDKADFIHIHWVQNNFLSVKSLLFLLDKYSNKIIFNLHDTCLLNKGFHIDIETSNLNYFRKFISKRNQKLLHKMIKLNIPIIVPSNYLESLAKTKNIRNVEIIPNTINVNNFNQKKAQVNNSIQKNILFGAINTKDKNKGVDDFIKLLNIIKSKINIKVYVFGNNSNFKIQQPLIQLGYIKNEKEIRDIYANADLYVTTSKYESFNQTVVESISTGTPVLCYDYSAAKEIVIHKKNGYIAKYNDLNDLIKGFNYCLNIKELKLKYFNEYVKNNYGYNYVVEKYLKFYKIKKKLIRKT